MIVSLGMIGKSYLVKDHSGCCEEDTDEGIATDLRCHCDCLADTQGESMLE